MAASSSIRRGGGGPTGVFIFWGDSRNSMMGPPTGVFIFVDSGDSMMGPTGVFIFWGDFFDKIISKGILSKI